jgi:D-tagatose-1,6-bisphosphate aldolase subunit GatZ/KbaZ
VKALLDLVARHKRGESVGVWSLCSAHPLVIEAAMHEANANGAPLLIEATCNQVNQFGGYTGMTPEVFHRFVRDIVHRLAFPEERLWLGGDQLGPNAWRDETAEIAMDPSDTLVAQYVAAGFRKIHLDCSMACADDPSPLPEALIASRAAGFCSSSTLARSWGRSASLRAGLRCRRRRRHQGAARTGGLSGLNGNHDRDHRRAFTDAGLSTTWSRATLVVQPGVSSIITKSSTPSPRGASRLERIHQRGRRSSCSRRIHGQSGPRRAARARARPLRHPQGVGPAATFRCARRALSARGVRELRDCSVSARSTLKRDALHTRHWRGLS